MANRGNRAAIQLALLLDKEEQERLLHFLSATYCTGLPAQNDCYDLMHYVLREMPSEEAEEIDAEELFAKVFPRKTYTKRYFDDLMALLYSLVKKFIHFEITMLGMDKKEQAQKDFGLSLLRFLNLKKSEKKFWTFQKSLSHLQQKQTGWEGKDYHWNYLVDQELTLLLSLNNTKKDDLNLLKSIRALEEYFLVEYMVQIYTLYAQNQVTSLGLEHWRKKLIFDPNAENLRWFFSKPIGRLLLFALEFLEEEAPGSPAKDFEAYDQLLLKEETNLPPVVLKNLETICCNYLTKRYVQGDAQLLEPLLRIFKRRESRGRIYWEGKILISEFQNCVTVGLRAKDYVWVKKFLDDNKYKIVGTEHPEDCYEYNLANYYFHIKEYDMAHGPLFQINYEEMQYKISAKLLQIMLLYETNEEDYFYSCINAARVFFSREKKKEKNSPSGKDQVAEDDKTQKGNVPEHKRKPSLNFLNKVEAIAELRLMPDRRDIEALMQEIRGIDTIAERIWLLEKLQEMLDKLNKKKE
ncbi:MAG: hypothetical protein H7246_20120 [Phycisphaerae bacterium]|nr:hypothetical protein [Saprospiraceae bacterium]